MANTPTIAGADYVLVQPVFEEGFAKSFLHFAFTDVGVLPPVEADDAHNLVDVTDHALDLHACAGLRLNEQLVGIQTLAYF